MFTIPPYFISQIFEDGGTSGGSDTVESTDSNDSVDDDLGVPYVAPSVEQDKGEVQSTEPESQGGISPAWKAVLDPLPQEFHKQVLPHLESWDKNFAEVQSRFAPYKPLLENNISIDDIQSSLQLAQFISADPQAVYEELGRRYGFGKEQGREQVDDSDKQEQQEQQYLDLAESEQNPQLLQLQQTVMGLQQMLQQKEEAQQEIQIRETAQREIDNEWAAIEQNIGRQLPPDVRNEVISRAVIIGDKTGNYSITEGYKDYAEFVNRVRNSRANNTAPSVLPGNGGQPVTKKNIGQMDDEERQNHIAEMTRMLVEGQK